MSLITVLSFANVTSTEIVMPVNAALQTREFVGWSFSNGSSVNNARLTLAIQNCKLDSGATFTAEFSQRAAMSNGAIDFFQEGTFLARADQLTTLTGVTSSPVTGTMLVIYNTIPLGGSDNWTQKT